jgi:hypothetical protein
MFQPSFGLVGQRGIQRMNVSKTSAADAAATPSSVESIHSVRKPTLSALSDEHLPYQPVMAV